jgi:uncharacterized phage protein (TIGR01671 family)
MIYNIDYRIRNGKKFEYSKVDGQRFTGRKDINDVKIYEGDIVALHLATNYSIRNSPKFAESLGRYEILWYDFYCSFMLRVLEKNWFDSSFITEEEMKKQTVDWKVCPGIIITENHLRDYKNLEVIGNIYDSN